VVCHGVSSCSSVLKRVQRVQRGVLCPDTSATTAATV
jgi:hypothetical protein